jgi:putative SOS response-associated peptidase YedK
MCGRYTLTNPDDLAARFGIEALTETRIEPRFNVAPSQAVSVVVAREDGPALATMRWGFQPAWMKTNGQRPPPINARSESLLERPMFRGAVAHGRCLIPADGFYEWMVVPGRKTKQPMYIRLKGGPIFAFAGLYVQGRDEVGETCVIVTTAANDVISPIHERMPVILDRSVEQAWLDRDLEDGQAALSYLQPVSPDQFEVYPVSSQVSSARNEGPDLVQPLEGAVTGAPRLL